MSAPQSRLEQGGRLRLSAMTGRTQVNADSPEIAPLYSVLQWVASFRRAKFTCASMARRSTIRVKKLVPSFTNISRKAVCEVSTRFR